MSNVFHDADELIQAELPAYEPPPAWIPPEHVKYLFVFAFGCMQQVFRHVRMFVSIIAHFPGDRGGASNPRMATNLQRTPTNNFTFYGYLVYKKWQSRGKGLLTSELSRVHWKNETMLNLSKLCQTQSDKSMTGFAPSLKIQVYDDHIVCKVVINWSKTSHIGTSALCRSLLSWRSLYPNPKPKNPSP